VVFERLHLPTVGCQGVEVLLAWWCVVGLGGQLAPDSPLGLPLVFGPDDSSRLQHPLAWRYAGLREDLDSQALLGLVGDWAWELTPDLLCSFLWPNSLLFS
jgi:hypothetical protein